MKYHIIRNSDERGKFLPRGVFLALIAPRDTRLMFVAYSVGLALLAFAVGALVAGSVR